MPLDPIVKHFLRCVGKQHPTPFPNFKIYGFYFDEYAIIFYSNLIRWKIYIENCKSTYQTEVVASSLRSQLC